MATNEEFQAVLDAAFTEHGEKVTLAAIQALNLRSITDCALPHLPDGTAMLLNATIEDQLGFIASVIGKTPEELEQIAMRLREQFSVLALELTSIPKEVQAASQEFLDKIGQPS